MTSVNADNEERNVLCRETFETPVKHARLLWLPECRPPRGQGRQTIAVTVLGGCSLRSWRTLVTLAYFDNTFEAHCAAEGRQESVPSGPRMAA